MQLIQTRTIWVSYWCATQGCASAHCTDCTSTSPASCLFSQEKCDSRAHSCIFSQPCLGNYNLSVSPQMQAHLANTVQMCEPPGPPVLPSWQREMLSWSVGTASAGIAALFSIQSLSKISSVRTPIQVLCGIHSASSLFSHLHRYKEFTAAMSSKK